MGVGNSDQRTRTAHNNSSETAAKQCRVALTGAYNMLAIYRYMTGVRPFLHVRGTGLWPVRIIIHYIRIYVRSDVSLRGLTDQLYFVTLS